MTCRDCIHCDVCNYWLAKQGKHLECAEGFICDDFKDKSKVIELPYKVGDKLYTILGITIIEHTARRFSFQRTNFSQDMQIYIHTEYGMISANDIGKTVFLTREEAENALKERENR